MRENDLIDLMIDCIKEEGAGAEKEIEKLDTNDNKDIHEQYEKVILVFSSLVFSFISTSQTEKYS